MSRSGTRRPTPVRASPPHSSRPGGAVWVAASAIVLSLVVVWWAGIRSEVVPQAAVELTAQGAAGAGGVVVDGAHVEMGRVPLDLTVVPEWVLTNAGSEPVVLGAPHASVVEGCCPGPLTLGADRLSPGESTTLSFPLAMHAGMDGPHDFEIHVPIGSADLLTLRVTGHFED